jgi:hypothetical protein
MKKLLEICGIYKVTGIKDEEEKYYTAKVAKHTTTIFSPIFMICYIIIVLI